LAGSQVDVVGLGGNATDTVIRLEKFPAPGGKQQVLEVSRHAGGPVATALVTCRRLGLRVRYLGVLGNDEAGEFQLASLRRERIDLRSIRTVPGARSQVSYILVDGKTGERTVLWEKDPQLMLLPAGLAPKAIISSRVLHLDGSHGQACLWAARLARSSGIPVVADLDALLPGVEELLPSIDYVIASAEFLAAASGIGDPVRALKSLAQRTRSRLVGATLGRDGALVLSEGRFLYSPGFEVRAIDTTGAGDVFHGAFIYGLVRGWNLKRILDFSNAMAALNSTALGARGGIASQRAAERLMTRGRRNLNRAYVRAR
jgi:sulfofructose kinase